MVVVRVAAPDRASSSWLQTSVPTKATSSGAPKSAGRTSTDMHIISISWRRTQSSAIMSSSISSQWLVPGRPLPIGTNACAMETRPRTRRRPACRLLVRIRRRVLRQARRHGLRPSSPVSRLPRQHPPPLHLVLVRRFMGSAAGLAGSARHLARRLRRARSRTIGTLNVSTDKGC